MLNSGYEQALAQQHQAQLYREAKEESRLEKALAAITRKARSRQPLQRLETKEA